MKNLKIIFIGIISLFVGINSINAAGSISVNTSSIYVGDVVTVSVTVSNAAAWEVHIAVSGAASASNCGTLDFADSSADALNTSKTYTATCKPTKTGTVTFSLSGNTTDASGNTTNISGSKSVSVVNRPSAPPVVNTPPAPVTPKSSVNYLSGLEVEGFQLSPNFDKETSEYIVELPTDTTSINIKATPEHNKANINGIGIVNVTEGINNLNILVTAENGSTRTYNLKAIVKEKDPIVVTIDNEKYTVIRKREQLISASSFYSETTIKINEQEIPAYYGEITGYTLVGLKNSEGIINLYTYDEDNQSYKLYQEFNFAKTIFYPINIKDEEIPKYYSKYNVIINDVELPCYKMNEHDNFMLLYGVNIENNHEGFYVYDAFENTLQRYNENIFDVVNEEINVLKSIIIGLFSIIIVVVVTAAIQGSTSNTKKVVKIKQEKNKEELEKIKQKKENQKEARLLEKELKRKEKEKEKNKPKPKKRKKNYLDDTALIDISEINIRKNEESDKK